jgi:predicted enzyme related to lactoylglutathione lyase
MKVDRVVPNLIVADLERASAEHREALGLEVLMDHGWIVTLGDEAGHQLSLMTEDASAPVNPAVSIFVDDVHEALARVQAAGLEIVHPLTDEPWGVTRFFYRDSQGQVINVGMHSPAATSSPGPAG